MLKPHYFVRICQLNHSQYKTTVHLPQTTFPLNVKNKAKHEAEVQQICKFDDLYKWQSDSLSSSKSFVLHDGPPYANGDVHVGHALNKVLKDITNRYKLLQSYKVSYKPGWDCHGLPIEIKAIKFYNIKKLSALEIREKAKAFAENTILHQKSAFQKWGIMGDWNNPNGCYYTYSPSYQETELLFFYEMYKKELIYRDLKPIYWSPSSTTALAESELEYNTNHLSKSVYTTFPIISSPFFYDMKDKASVLVWTTQPWTLPANQALCYNSKFLYSLISVNDSIYLVANDTISRISNELGMTCEIIKTIDSEQLRHVVCTHPMDPSRFVKLFPAAHVNTEKGSGIVHTAPAHGVEDFDVGQKYSLNLESTIDKHGCFTASSGFSLKGKYIFTEGNNSVIDILCQQGNLCFLRDFIHSYPYDWRTKQEVFVQTSKQWFINTIRLQDGAMSALENVEFQPAHAFQRMKSLLDKRTFWCISRQRVWGVPIPVFYHKNTGEVLINDTTINHLRSLIKEHGSDVWFTSPISTLLPESVLQTTGYDGPSSDYEIGTDILDIWFDSGISWASVLRSKNSDAMPVADMYLEGKDQFNGWFQSSLLTSVALQGKAPYKKVLVHGFCVADDGKKMSKSVGNVVDPMVVVNGGKDKVKEPSYGADALRWWVAQSNPFSEIFIGKNIMDDSSVSVQKVRACLRFLMSNLHEFDEDKLVHNRDDMKAVDQYYCYRLQRYVDQVTDDYNHCRYSTVAITILGYTTELSSVYFSILKDRLYCEDKDGNLRRSAQTTIYYILEALIKTVAPILPHLTEEAMLHHPCPKSSSAFKDGWFQSSLMTPLFKPSVVAAVRVGLRLREGLLLLLTNRKIAQTACYDVTVYAPADLITSHLQTLQSSTSSRDSTLCQLLSCAQSTITMFDHLTENLTSTTVEIVVNNRQYNVVVAVKLSEAFKCPRCRKHTSESNGQVCERCTRVLSDGWDS